MRTLNLLFLLLFLMIISCQKKTGDFALSGKVANPSTFFKKQSSGAAAKKITHVMAISPESADPKRFVTELDQDGSFQLNVDSGKPYVLVFVAAGQNFKGPDMIVGLFKITSIDLDTLAPVKAGEADLGNVDVDANKKQATISSTVDTLLTSLGLTAAEAAFFGKIDNLSLRAANPDIDGNGVIDSTENKQFHMDWHVRADTFVGDKRAKFSDAVGTFLNNPTLTYSLNSAYAVYPNSFYAGICPSNSGVSLDLAAGCGFDILTLEGTSVLSSWPHTSMSGGSYADMYQWGPDFRPNPTPPITPAPEPTPEPTPGPTPVSQIQAEEMPGSNGIGVQMVYTMPGDKKLTFWNVITRTNASLTADGMILPFLKFMTSDGTSKGTISSIEFEWRKLENSSWNPATATEIALIVNDNGGYATFYTQKNPGHEAGFSVNIPHDVPSGSIPWDTEHVNNNGAGSVSSATLHSFCNHALSYDDRLGLRIFAGGFAPNDGVTLCP